tara:strand:+ start:86 stop:196 length:111 start_codon:yes stop_codon:yes gene_type:complete
VGERGCVGVVASVGAGVGAKKVGELFHDLEIMFLVY